MKIGKVCQICANFRPKMGKTGKTDITDKSTEEIEMKGDSVDFGFLLESGESSQIGL